jgi:hypothetical protein
MVAPLHGPRSGLPPRNRGASNASTLPTMAARTLSLYTFLLAIVLALGACKKDDLANETMTELSALADQIVKTVNEAEDKKAGVAEAQKALDAKKVDLAPKMKEIMELRGFEVSEDVAAKVNSVRTEAATKVIGLELGLIAQISQDAELEKALDKLTTDFGKLIDGE